MPIKISILLTFMLLAKQPTFSSSFCETYETNTPEKIIDYINNVISGIKVWIKNPESKSEKIELQNLIKKFDTLKIRFEAYVILKESKNEESFLSGILHRYNDNPDSVINQLLIWKYQTLPLPSIKLVADLTELINEVQGIMKILSSEDDYKNAFNVLSSKDRLETEIIPFSKILIENIKRSSH